MKRQIALLAATLAILPIACCSHIARPSVTASACEVADLRTLYTEPTQSFGKTFCGEAFARLDSSFEIFVLPTKDWKSDQDITLVLAKPSNEHLRSLWGRRKEGRIWVQARLDAVEACFEARTEDEECVPYRRPIVLTASKIERLD